MDVTLLGCGGMLPKKDRWLTSCYIACEGHAMLIDCGEGTQIAIKHAQRRITPIDLICITHFHADHVSGIPGFLLSLGNEGRTEPVTIAGPKGIGRIISCLCVIAPNLPFEVKIAELADSQKICCGEMKITPFKAKHTVECLGYSVYLPRQGKFDAEKAKANGVPMKIWSKLQKLGQAEYEGKKYTFDMVGGEARKGIKVSYCTDSRPTSRISDAVKDSDLFICEGLYYEEEKLDHCRQRGHMTFCEASSLAAMAGVKEMWLTHFSPALTDPEAGLPAAREIFPATFCGNDGKTVDLCFE